MIQKTDKKAFLSILVAAILITTIPYVLAIANQGDKWVFSGFLIGVEDGNSYLAKMLSGSVGEWVFRTPYTTFPQTGIFAFFPYILLGKLASPPALHIQLIILYQLFRWIGIFIYILGTYKLLRLFISSDHCRTIALLLSAFGGGLGWLFPILGIKELAGTIPIDFYSPETFGFLSIYSLPHLSAARGLMFLALANHISVIKSLPETVGKSLYTGGILFIAGIFQPLNSAIGFILIIIVSISYLLLSKDHQSERSSIFKHAIFAAIPVIPLIAYYGIAQYTDPFYKAWTAQNIITSPNPVHYLLGFAVPILVIILNIRALARIMKTVNGFFLITWIILFLTLAYIPYNLQRRIPDGILVAFIALMFILLENTNKRTPNHISIGIVLIMIPSSLVIITNGILSSVNQFEPVFIPRSRTEAYTIFSDQINKGSHVLSNYQIGNEFPAWASVFVVVGHGPESINKKGALADTRKFFNTASSDAARNDILKTYHVDFVIRDKNIEPFPENQTQLPCFLEFLDAKESLELFKVKQCEEHN